MNQCLHGVVFVKGIRVQRGGVVWRTLSCSLQQVGIAVSIVKEAWRGIVLGCGWDSLGWFRRAWS